MNCTQAQKNLQLYIDGRLDQRHFSLLEAHLDACATCHHDLAMYETLRLALANSGAEREPADMTTLIMARIASAEKSRIAQARQPFAWRWTDGLLAALLGTASTLIFLLINPMLRDAFFSLVGRTFPQLTLLMQAQGPDAIPWVVWLLWITIGLSIAIWLAGAEVRTTWKRALIQRLQTPPQFHLW